MAKSTEDELLLRRRGRLAVEATSVGGDIRSVGSGRASLARYRSSLANSLLISFLGKFFDSLDLPGAATARSSVVTALPCAAIVCEARRLTQQPVPVRRADVPPLAQQAKSHVLHWQWSLAGAPPRCA